MGPLNCSRVQTERTGQPKHMTAQRALRYGTPLAAQQEDAARAGMQGIGRTRLGTQAWCSSFTPWDCVRDLKWSAGCRTQGTEPWPAQPLGPYRK